MKMSFYHMFYKRTHIILYLQNHSPNPHHGQGEFFFTQNLTKREIWLQ